MDKNHAYVASELYKCETPAARTKRIKELCAYYNVSESTICRWAEKGGFRARGERRDKGTTKVPMQYLKEVAGRLYISRRLKGTFTNTVADIVEQMEAAGTPPPASVSTICAQLKAHKLDKESLSKPDPHVRIDAERPNRLWEFDISNCLKYYFSKTAKRMMERDVESEFYKNKLIQNAKKVKTQILRYVMVDRKTGSFFVWYYEAPGERAEDGADFLYKAFSPKKDIILRSLGYEHTGAYQMHGVPFILMADKGSIMKELTIRNLLEKSLNVQLELHQAGNPRAKGAVEGIMPLIENKFESILKLHNPSSVDELNKWVLSWCIKHNEQAKFRGKYIRADLWQKITAEELRLCPPKDVFTTCLHTPLKECSVNGNGQLSYKGKKYSVPYSDWAHQKVLVSTNAYEYPAVNIHCGGLVHTAKPDSEDEFGEIFNTEWTSKAGEFKAIPHSSLQKGKTALEEHMEEKHGVKHTGNKIKRLAQSAPVKTQAEALADVPAEMRPAPEDEKIEYLPKQGVAMNVPDVHKPQTEAAALNIPAKIETPERFISVPEFIMRLVKAGHSLTVEENRALTAEFADGISLTKAAELYEAIMSGTYGKEGQDVNYA